MDVDLYAGVAKSSGRALPKKNMVCVNISLRLKGSKGVFLLIIVVFRS
jgi:hypothetical protein